jgi:hypothetical protein
MGNRSGRLREQQQPLASDAAYANAGPAPGVTALFSDVPRVLLVITIVLVLILIFAIASLALLVQTKNECEHETSTSCGAGGKDMSGLIADDDNLFWTQDNTNYYLHVCGPVVLSPSSQCYGQLPANSQAYQATSGSCTSYASYAAGVGRWASTDFGLTYTNTYGGSYCGNNLYNSLVVNFQCNTATTKAYVSSVTQYNCVYTFFVQTKQAC